MSDAADTAVLIVEDEALIAMLMADTLAGAGYGPVWIPDGRAPSAMLAAGAAGPAAAVVDLQLADGLDGRDVVRRLRHWRRALPVVVVTGFHPEAPQADLRGLGGLTLRLCKPFDCDDLAGSVAAMAGAPAAAREPPVAAPRRRRSDRVAEPAQASRRTAAGVRPFGRRQGSTNQAGRRRADAGPPGH